MLSARVWLVYWAALTLFADSVSPVLARAQEPAPDASGVDARQEAELEELVARAVAAYDAGELTTARALFEAVHARRPTARTLRSLGLLAYREGRIADAVALLEAALASRVRPLTQAQREGAITLLNEARPKLPSELGAAAPEARVRAVEAPQSPSATAPAVASPPAPPEQARPVGPRQAESALPAAKSSARTADARERRLFRARYGLLGAGAGALLFGLASYITGLVRVKRIEGACKEMPDGRCFSSDLAAREREEKLPLLNKLALGGVIAGGAAVASGSLLFLWRPSAERSAAELQVGYRGSF